MTHPVQTTPYGANGTGGVRAVFGQSNLQQTADAVPINIAQGTETPACSCSCCESDAVQYFGQATQNVPAGSQLLLTQYSPAGDATPQQAIRLPRGRYMISYSVNASAVNAGCPMNDPACTVTLGIAPWLNRENFTRGGSFATIRAEGSTTLSSTFVVSLNNEQNNIGFYNPGQQDTNYQLLNVTIHRVG